MAALRWGDEGECRLVLPCILRGVGVLTIVSLGYGSMNVRCEVGEGGCMSNA